MSGLLESHPPLGRVLVQHFSDDLERLWLTSMMEVGREATRAQRCFTRLLLSASAAYAAPAAPLLCTLRALPDAALSGREPFEQIPILDAAIDALGGLVDGGVAAVTPAATPELLPRAEGVVRAATSHLWRVCDQLAKLSAEGDGVRRRAREPSRSEEQAAGECRQAGHRRSLSRACPGPFPDRSCPFL